MNKVGIARLLLHVDNPYFNPQCFKLKDQKNQCFGVIFFLGIRAMPSKLHFATICGHEKICNKVFAQALFYFINYTVPQSAVLSRERAGGKTLVFKRGVFSCVIVTKYANFPWNVSKFSGFCKILCNY